LELTREKKLIDGPENPVGDYNYSYIKDLISQKYGNEVSVSTIISRVKKYGFHKKKKEKAAHDHEVVTNYVRELVQNDRAKLMVEGVMLN
jgi:hypothetical protein